MFLNISLDYWLEMEGKKNRTCDGGENRIGIILFLCLFQKSVIFIQSNCFHFELFCFLSLSSLCVPQKHSVFHRSHTDPVGQGEGLDL